MIISCAVRTLRYDAISLYNIFLYCLHTDNPNNDKNTFKIYNTKISKCIHIQIPSVEHKMNLCSVSTRFFPHMHLAILVIPAIPAIPTIQAIRGVGRRAGREML